MRAQIPPDQKFTHSWCFWYAKRPTPEEMKLYGKYDAQERIAINMNEKKNIASAQMFWSNFLLLPKLSTLPNFHKMSLMRKDLTPSWSTPILVERKGGVISIFLDKQCAEEAILYILLILVGDLIKVKRGHTDSIEDQTLCMTCGCSIMCAKRWEQGVPKEWVECSIFHDCVARQEDILKAFEKLLREHVSNFVMTQEVKFHQLG